MAGGKLKVAIVGPGRLGSLLAAAVPASYRKVIVGRQKASAQDLADELGAVASDQLSSIRGSDVVFLAVPAAAVVPVLQGLQPHTDAETLVVNMSTEVLTAELAPGFPGIRLASAKVVGQAREIAHGSPGVVILDQVDAEAEWLLRELLGGLGTVIRDNEAKVLAINTAVAEEMLRAEANLRRRLTAMGLSHELISTAIRTTGPGVLRSLAGGDAGPFVQGIARRMAGDLP